MQCSIGYVKNSNQLIVKSLDTKNNSSKNKVVNIEELGQENLQALFYEEEQIENEQLKEAMLNNAKYFPIREAGELSLSVDSFENLNIEQSQEVLNKVLNNWVLQNNMSLLEDMYDVTDHLNNLWPNDRTAFFEELWFLLKNNLGSKSLRLIYNDLKKVGKNDDKNTLIQVLVTGDKVPNPQEGKELEQKLMEEYKTEFSNNFSVVEFSLEKGQIVLAGNIKGSPLLIMAEINDFTHLQKSLLKTFITSLSR